MVRLAEAPARPAGPRGAGWPVVALLLLAGLLGMHGLTGHHGSMPGEGAGPSSSHAMTAAHPPGSHLVTAAQPPGSHLVMAAPLEAPPAVDVPAGTSAACKAVPASGVAPLLGPVGRRLGSGVDAGAGTRSPRARHAVGPPDLVAGLCVSRT